MTESERSYIEISPLTAFETLKHYPQTKVYGRLKGTGEIKRIYSEDMLVSHRVYSLHDLLNRMSYYIDK